MKVISVNEFFSVLGETVSTTSPSYGKIIEVINGCTQYEIDEDLVDAMEALKRYFNKEN